MQLPWYVTALGAALVWGIHYPLIDHALKRISLVSVLALTAIPIVLTLPWFYPALRADCSALQQMSWAERAPVLAILVTSLAGAVLLYVSIAGKNATLASLIEISYPLFVALFAWVLFREAHLNASVVAGAALVFAGVGIIVWHNP